MDDTEFDVDALLARARAGDAEAQCQLGWCYRAPDPDDKRVTYDPEQAHYWFSKAAEQAYAPAFCGLAFLCKTGTGVIQDLRKAFEFYMKAAELGDVEGEFQVAVAYSYGNGVRKNKKREVLWLRKAATQGHPGASSVLASIFADKDDIAEAAKWYRKAAESGNGDAQYQLARLYEQGVGVPKSDREAFFWYLKAAEQDNVQAYVPVADRYREGRGVAQNGMEALRWYMKGAALESHMFFWGSAGEAEMRIGEVYAKGLVVPKDLVEAYKWFNVAAAKGGDPEEAVQERDQIEEIMTREEIDEAQKRTMEYLARRDEAKKDEDT